MNSLPVACRSQGGDVLKLRRQSDLNCVQSGQKCWIYTEFRRQVSESAPRLSSLFLESCA